MERIEQILWNNTTDELSRLCSKAKIKKTSGLTKDLKIKKLCEFYNNENWVREVFDELSKYEKEMMTCIIQYKYHPTQEILEKIMNKYNRKTWGDRFDRDSKTQLFYIEYGGIPIEFKEKLNELVEPINVEIKKTEEKIDPEEFYANIIGRDNKVSDFDEFIKFINVNKIKVTKAKEQLPKSALIKIHSKLKYKDVLRNDEIEFDNIRNIEDTIISNSIMNLLRNSLIIRVKKGEFYIDELFCEDYQKLNRVDKIKYLLKSYIRENSIAINECERIQSGNFRVQNKVPEFGNVRKMIIEYLKKCPINEWIDIDELKKYIRINNYCFLREYTGQVLIKDQYYNSYYNSASHDEFESFFVDIVIMEYMATLGVVDVVMDKDYDDYGYKTFMSPQYFKITEFGSYVLEMSKEEIKEKDDEKELEIGQDFRIIVGETNNKLKYELYFDRFLQKQSENPLIYKLNFKGMAKALELGIKFKDIFAYIEANCKNEIPNNVKSQFEEWIKESKKIKIKTLTVLEVDRDIFYEIIKNDNFKSYIDSIRNDVIVLKNNKIDDVKKELYNKRKILCVKQICCFHNKNCSLYISI